MKYNNDIILLKLFSKLNTMKNKIYFTYRRMYTDRWNRQDVSFYNDKQYSDMIEAGLTKMTDWSNFIPDERITKETAPWVKNLRVAGMLEFAMPELRVELEESLKSVAQSFSIELKTKDEMLEWVRTNTDLEEIETGKFLISEADELMETEERYLIIE